MRVLISALFGCLLALAAGAASAQPATPTQPAQPPAAAVRTQSETAIVQVNGLICDFCVQSVKRMAGQRAEVARTDVDLDRGRVTITFKAGQTLSDAVIRQLITNAGYAVVAITRGRA